MEEKQHFRNQKPSLTFKIHNKVNRDVVVSILDKLIFSGRIDIKNSLLLSKLLMGVDSCKKEDAPCIKKFVNYVYIRFSDMHIKDDVKVYKATDFVYDLYQNYIKGEATVKLDFSITNNTRKIEGYLTSVGLPMTLTPKFIKSLPPR